MGENMQKSKHFEISWVVLKLQPLAMRIRKPFQHFQIITAEEKNLDYKMYLDSRIFKDKVDHKMQSVKLSVDLLAEKLGKIRLHCSVKNNIKFY